MKLNALFVTLLCFSALALADMVPSGFSVSPSTFKPGISGTLSFTLTNNANISVTGVDLFPSSQYLTFFAEKTNVGTMGPGASTSVSIPFRVNSNAQAGVYNVQVSAYWVDSSGQNYKTFAYPITVASSVTFQASSVQLVEQQVHPGEAFNVDTVITNSGGAVKNVRVSSGSSQFTFSGSSQLTLGDKAEGQSSEIRIPFVASSDVTPGVYSIPVNVTYEDELGSTQSTQLMIGPITIYKRSIYFSVSTKQSVARILPGQKVNITVSLTNVGTEEARFVKVGLSPNSSSFVLLNAGEKYIDSIPVNSSRNVSFEVGVSTGTLPGFYPLRVSIGFADTRGVEQTALTQSTGLEVAGVSDLDVIASANPAPVTAGKKHTLSLQISNVGTFQLKSVRVRTSSTFFDLLGSPDQYIGTLNVDDYSTVTYPVYMKDGVQPGRYAFNTTITFRDSDNVERTAVKEAYLDIVSSEVAAKVSGTNGGGINGWFLLIAAIVIIVVAYFGYKKFFAPKRHA